MPTLWKCDDGTYDIVGDDGEIAHFNVPERLVASAPELLRVLKGVLANPNDTPTLEQAAAAIAALDL